jgi:plasmid stabilization system protein ParE
VQTVEVPVADISLSKDVENFKEGASKETGVVSGQELAGKYERLGTGPIVVWKRLDGSLEVITGRHRLDLARRSGEKTIPAQVVEEAKGFTKDMALTFDAESNIRDGQGSVEDYAHYFKLTQGLSEAEAVSRGLLSRAKGKAGWDLARSASDDLYALWKSGKVSEAQTLAAARAAPGNPQAQQIGAKFALQGKSPEFISNVIKASLAESKARGQTLDLFGNDDAAMKQMEAQADRAASLQRGLKEQISAVSGAVKKPEVAKKMGVDVNDPDAVRAKIGELKAQLERWENWPLHSDLVALTKGETKPSTDFETAYNSILEKQGKAAADAYADKMKRAGEWRPSSNLGIEPPKLEQKATKQSPTPEQEYDAAKARYKAVSQEHDAATKAFRSKQIGDAAFLAARKAFENARDTFDAAEQKFIDAKNAAEPPKPKPAAKPQELFSSAETPFNLTGDKVEMVEPKVEKTGYGNETLAQDELFGIQKVVESKDPAKSADAAQKLYGGAKEAIAKLENQLRVVDSDRETKKAFSKEQRSRLKDVITLLRQRAAEEPKIVGMGGAIPEEFARGQGSATSIKNATVDSERAKRGLPPAMEPARRSFGQVWDQAMAAVDRDPKVVDALIESLQKKPRALTDFEDALLLHRQLDLHHEYDKATRDLAQAYEDAKQFPEREAQAVEEKLRVARLSDELQSLYDLGKKVGTETGRGLNARKMMAHEDFTLAKMELESRAARGGRQLTDGERAEITALHDKIAESQKRYDEYVAQSQDRISKLEAQAAIDKLKVEAAKEGPAIHPKIIEIAEKLVKQLDARADAARARIKARMGKFNAGVDPTVLLDVADIGASYLGHKVLDSVKWADKMVGELGEWIRPHLEEIRSRPARNA